MDKPSPSDGAKEPVFEVPIQILEEALGRFFLPDHLQHLDLKFADCERLYSALYTYHQNNRIQPVKSPDTVRPNLSFVSLAQGVMVDRGAPPYKKGSYLPRNGDSQSRLTKSSALFFLQTPSWSKIRSLRFAVGLCAEPTSRSLRHSFFLKRAFSNWPHCAPSSKSGSSG
jgi:hypothetical protein